MKIKKSLLLLVCIVGFLIILYGIIQKPEPIRLSDLDKSNLSNNATRQASEKLPEGKYRKVADIGEVYGVTRVTNTLNDTHNGTYNGINGTYNGINGTYTYSGTPLPTATPIPPKPLPYPRIMINYTVTDTDSLQDQIAGNDSKFAIITLEIKNYGYKYFDAYPTKFRIKRSIEELEPWINISTGNSLDAVLPNNSMTIGDLIFKLTYDETRNPQLIYTNKSYTIMYEKISGRTIGKEENIEDINQGDIGD